MSNRSATETILGYFYQFDYTIFKILNLANVDDSIIVEGIEDVDIKTIDEEIATQCKYYAKTEYNHSIIAKPIRLMLNHFKQVKEGEKPQVQYYLYGYYKSGQDKLLVPLTVEFLKRHFLTYTSGKVKHEHHIELGLDNRDLENFIQKLTININAVSYVDQYEKIIDLLKSLFNCSSFQAEHYFYNNALKVIKELATQNKLEDRRISKSQFLDRIDNKKLLFNEWFVVLKGKKQFLANLRKEYFTSLNASPFERFFLIEIDERNYSRSDLKELLFLISRKWSNLSKRASTPFCPYVYIHNIPAEELIKLKSELYREGFKLSDGFDFAGASFSSESICETANYNNQIKLKIINQIDYLDLVLKETTRTKEVYQFYIEKSYYTNTHQEVKHIEIQVDEIIDIKEII
ncbi:DUF4297 family anti-phage-associated protein [Metabacillus litoralis]|uniref:DUF4297 family anti-phage-associated protein n=1 Tax=Metabacillus litoralis TaxID=152268 RepID=UPI00203AC2F0|nr:DUF4297 family anti-phage-associated protein [Metabacillus litoralis]MCM3160803.1 hypothetical protein [Metabacillus litoralis]